MLPKPIKVIVVVLTSLVLLMLLYFLVAIWIASRDMKVYEQQKIYLNIYNDGNSTIPEYEASFTLTSDASVLDALNWTATSFFDNDINFNLEVSWSEDNATISSLLGKDQGDNGVWVYFVNGLKIEEAPNKTFLSYGDIVEWRYVLPPQR